MKEQINKEFALSTWSIKNKMTVFVIILIIVVGGLISYKNMPREAFPEVVIPQIFMLFYAIYLRINQYDITINSSPSKNFS